MEPLRIGADGVLPSNEPQQIFEGDKLFSVANKWKNFKEEAVTGPSLYYFDDSTATGTPKGTLPIFGSTVGLPKRGRKGHQWLIRIEDSKAGDGDEETKHDKLVFVVDTEEERDVSALPLLSLTALQRSVCPRPTSPYIQPIER